MGASDVIFNKYAQTERAYTWRTRELLVMTAVSIAAFVAGIVGLVVGLIQRSADPATVAEALANLPAFSVGALALSAFSLTAAVWLGLRWRGYRWDTLGLASISRRGFILAMLCAVALRVAVVPLSLVLRALGFPMDNPQLEMLKPGDASWGVLFAIVLLAGLVVPLAEELFFRGVFYTWLRERWGAWVAVPTSAAVFGAIHGHPTLGVIAGVLGIVLALVVERTRSLTACVVVHATFNSLALALLYGLPALGIRLPEI